MSEIARLPSPRDFVAASWTDRNGVSATHCSARDALDYRVEGRVEIVSVCVEGTLDDRVAEPGVFGGFEHRTKAI